MTQETYACQNCDWTGSHDELNDIKDYDERVAPGEPEPTGECPECGALCHEADDEGEERTYSFKLGTWDITASNFDDAKRYLLDDLAEYVSEEHLAGDDDEPAPPSVNAELLAALERVTEFFGDLPGWGREAREALDAGRAAIAKAKGGT